MPKPLTKPNVAADTKATLKNYNPRAMQYNTPYEHTLQPDGSYVDPLAATHPEKMASIGVQSEAGRAFLMRQALTTIKDATPFTNMASTTYMPKNSGKYLECFEEFPVIHDKNINDQGLDAEGAYYENGNLYGSSDDINTINKAMPTITEIGGRVNRIGFSRSKRMGTFCDYGLFFEFTKSAVEYDTDPQLYTKMYNKIMEAAAKVYEDKLQIDLLNNAGTVMFAGSTFSLAENNLNAINSKIATKMGEMNETHVITYKDLVKLNAALDSLDVPSETKIITGSAKIDTRTLSVARVAFAGPEVIATLRTLRDSFNEPAFIPIEKYAGATSPLPNEVGSIAGFRVIKVQKFKVWRGGGADASSGSGNYYTTNGKYDVFPFLVVGDEAFTTIGFKSESSKGSKFTVNVKKPGADAVTPADPFGRTGMVSIQWTYGFMLLRPERLAIIRTLAAQ